MNDREELDLRRELRAMVADPPRLAPTTDLIAAARARRGRNRAGAVVVALLVAAAVAVPSVLASRDDGPPAVPVVAEPAAPSPTRTGDAVTDNPPAPPGTDLATGPEDPAVGTAFRYDLFVHCGIRYAKVGGRWWHADPEQPAPRTTYGGGLYLPGSMVLVSADEARFTSSVPGTTATFRPLAGDPEPCD